MSTTQTPRAMTDLIADEYMPQTRVRPALAPRPHKTPVAIFLAGFAVFAVANAVAVELDLAFAFTILMGIARLSARPACAPGEVQVTVLVSDRHVLVRVGVEVYRERGVLVGRRFCQILPGIHY